MFHQHAFVNKMSLIYTFLLTTPLVLDLEHVTLVPAGIPLPKIGHICVHTYINIYI